MKALQLAGCFAFVLLGFGCQTYPDVHPMASGIHKVSFKTERKGEGFREAMPQAQAYCKDVAQKSAIQVSETSEYIGNIDEATYNAGKTASQVAVAVGATGAVFGGEKESDVGSVTAVGGGIANSALGLGYQYTLEFRCE